MILLKFWIIVPTAPLEKIKPDWVFFGWIACENSYIVWKFIVYQTSCEIFMFFFYKTIRIRLQKTIAQLNMAKHRWKIRKNLLYFLFRKQISEVVLKQSIGDQNVPKTYQLGRGVRIMTRSKHSKDILFCCKFKQAIVKQNRIMGWIICRTGSI